VDADLAPRDVPSLRESMRRREAGGDCDVRQTVFLARLLIVLLVLAPLALPSVAGATLQTPSTAHPLVPVSAAQDVADLSITALNCPAGVVPDVDAAGPEILGEEALIALGCVPAEGVLFDVRVDGQRLLDDAPTANGLLLVDEIAPGSRVVVRENVPAGYVPLSRRVQSTTAGNEPLALFFVNEEVTAGATADLTIVKLNCPPGIAAADLADDEELAEAVVAGQADLAGLGCALADGVPFAVDGVDAGETVGGFLVVAALPAGAQVTVTEIVPAGFEAVNPEQIVTVGPGAVTLFVDVVAETPPAVADLTIVKLNCGAVIDPDAVDLAGLVGGEATVLPPGCELAEGVPFAVAGQDAGSTEGGLLIVEDLPAGSQATVTETVPPGFQAQSPEQVVTLPESGVAVLFVNVPVAPQTADLLIVKLNCAEAVDLETVDVAAVVEAGLATDVLDADCQPADGVAFAVDGEPVGTTADGLLSVEGFAVGAEVTVTETVPAEVTALDPEQTVRLAAGDNAVLFVNIPAAPEVADLTVIKLNCVEEIDPAAISPTTVRDGAVPEGCELAEGVGFTATDASGAEVGSGTTADDGLLVFADLPVGAAVTVTETVPRFSSALDGEQTATVGEDASLLFVDVRGRGRVEAVKLFCGDQDRAGEIDFFVDDAAVEGCRRATAGEVTFALSSPAGEVARGETDGDGMVRFDVLAGPNYVLTEVTPDQNDVDSASDPFVVETDQMVAGNVVDYVLVTGDILVAKLACAELIDTTIEVARFGVPEGEELGEFGCVHQAADFVIFPYGDRQGEPIELESDEDGITYLSDIPVTTDETGPHLLVELGSGAEELFTVGAGELTVIEVVNAIAPPVGTLVVSKQTCADVTEIDVEIVGPVTSDTAALPVPDAGCAFAAAEFALYPYGDLEGEPIRFATDPESPVLLPAVPITTDEAQPHVLIEEGTGLEVRFAVAVGAVTVIEVTNPEERAG
jgi:hypothetical protein